MRPHRFQAFRAGGRITALHRHGGQQLPGPVDIAAEELVEVAFGAFLPGQGAQRAQRLLGAGRVRIGRFLLHMPPGGAGGLAGQGVGVDGGQRGGVQRAQALHGQQRVVLLPEADDLQRGAAALQAVIKRKPAPEFGFFLRLGGIGQRVEPAGHLVVERERGGRAAVIQQGVDALAFVQAAQQRLRGGPGLGFAGLAAGQEDTVGGRAELFRVERLLRPELLRIGPEIAARFGFFSGRLRRFGAVHMGGDSLFGRHAIIEEVPQNAAVDPPVGVVHRAVVHADARAVGPFDRHRHLLGLHAEETRQLHEQRRDLGFGKVGLHKRQHRVEQVVQLCDRGVLHLVEHGLDDRALPHDALPVVVDGAQAGVLQRRVAVQVVEPGVHTVHDQHRVGGDLPVECGGLLLGQFDVDTADGVDDLHEGVEVEAHIVVHLHAEAGLDRVHGQARAAVAEGVGDPVVFVLVFVQQDRHAGGALDRDELDRILVNVERGEDQAVGAGVGAELGRRAGAVELAEVGERVGVVDGFGALVGADEQHIEHRIIRKRAALRHEHLPVAVRKAGAVQVLVLACADGADAVDGAVVIVDQVQLAVDIGDGQPQHDEHQAEHAEQDAQRQRQARPVLLFRLLFGLRRGLLFRFVLRFAFRRFRRFFRRRAVRFGPLRRVRFAGRGLFRLAFRLLFGFRRRFFRRRGGRACGLLRVRPGGRSLFFRFSGGDFRLRFGGLFFFVFLFGHTFNPLVVGRGASGGAGRSSSCSRSKQTPAPQTA